MRHLPPSDQAAEATSRLALRIGGCVQGVGFRPFVYRLAKDEGLAGWVRNTLGGVAIEVEGEEPAVARFLSRIEAEARTPAVVETVASRVLDLQGGTGFHCLASAAEDESCGRVLPDLVVCDACRAEISDPNNRRYRYSFTSCMHCGPRYSIIEALPYDRERTVMRHFPMCSACEREYRDPASRRFHAETNACPECGPQLALLDRAGVIIASPKEAFERSVTAIRQGSIVAVKGLGGFQLLVDARCAEAVATLRARKRRPAKPFAVMVPTPEHVRKIAQVTQAEEDLLCSASGPIVLLTRLADVEVNLAENITPGNPLVGMMMPTTPLHHLLLQALGFPIVCTSGNRTAEPLVADDGEALARLSGIADLILTHDRPILNRVDDSVVRMIGGEQAILRCARGLAPVVLEAGEQEKPVLALGGHLKNSLAVGVGERIILGPHIGDLDSAETRALYDGSTERFARLHGVQPCFVAHDGHPGYYSTEFSETTDLPAHKVQHHLAHVLAGMAEHRLESPVLGIAWDGSGDGGDGTIWGGEFLLVDGSRWRRIAHMRNFPLPGGDSAIREPRRAAIGALSQCYGDTFWKREQLPAVASFMPPERVILREAMKRKINAPLTSSVGRMFDVVASVLGLRHVSSFEGEAAMAVEFAATRSRNPAALPAPFLNQISGARQVDWRPMLEALCESVLAGVSTDDLAGGFHVWLSKAACIVARGADVRKVVLTGGCFQNALLCELVARDLREAGFQPYPHRKIPSNDGGLAVGQAAFAASPLMQEES